MDSNSHNKEQTTDALLLLAQLSANESNNDTNNHNQSDTAGTQQTILLDEDSEFPEFFDSNIGTQMPNLSEL